MVDLIRIFYSQSIFWFALTLINIFICYRYYYLSKIENKAYYQIKEAFGGNKLYINNAEFVTLDNESEANLCLDLGNYMLSSSKNNKEGFLLAAGGAIMTAIAAAVTFYLNRHG